MWHWRQIAHGLRALARREESDNELSDEVRHFLQQAEADLVERGATFEEARRTVRLRHGDGLAAREDVRAYGWERGVEDLYADLRLAARRLRRSPGFTIIVVLILGLGIGSATAILSAVSPVLFQPLPYPDADRILAVSDRAGDGTPIPVTFGTYLELSERTRSFEALSVFKPWQPTLTGGEEPERLEGQRVSANYFQVLGVAPLGRGFAPSSDRPGGPAEVVLSDGLWRTRFGADPAIVGQTVELDSAPYLVVGVMPAGFDDVTRPGTRLWALLQYDPLVASFDTREWGHHLQMVGRLKAGVSLERARQHLDAIAGQAVPEFSRPRWASMAQGLALRRLKDAAMAEARPTSLVLLGAVGLLLAVACVNLTVLLLARGLRRGGELSVRAALGAGRGRLVRQILTENLVLVGLGGLFGVWIARLGLSALVAVRPPTLPQIGAVELDGATLGFALAVTTLVGVVVGWVPALARSVEPALPTGRRSTGNHRAMTRTLVIVEVAFALVLLVGAGLLLRSTERLFSIPTGFDPSSIVVMQVHTTGLEGGDAATHRFWNEALDAVQAVPGVRAAALTSQLPLSGDLDIYGVAVDDANQGEASGGPAFRYAVSPGYFATMGISVLQGRTLGPRDTPGAEPVAVVSESFAKRLFPSRGALGRRIRVGPVELPPYTIVGVVDDVKQESLEVDAADAVYVTSEQWHSADRVRWIVVQAEGEPLGEVPAVRRAVWSVDDNQPIVRVQSMEEMVLRSEARRQFVMSVLGAFSSLALVLAALGLYGVLSGSVAERMPEIGVRIALGASRQSILALVLRQGMTLTAIGAAIGLLGAAVTSQVLVAFIFGVSRLDPLTYLGAVALLTLASAAACWLPASRASRMDPLATLKAD
ncbi:MAG: ADOP family duplicated permease [Acidobacteriota bacterium]